MTARLRKKMELRNLAANARPHGGERRHRQQRRIVRPPCACTHHIGQQAQGLLCVPFQHRRRRNCARSRRQIRPPDNAICAGDIQALALLWATFGMGIWRRNKHRHGKRALASLSWAGASDTCPAWWVMFHDDWLMTLRR